MQRLLECTVGFCNALLPDLNPCGEVMQVLNLIILCRVASGSITGESWSRP